MTFPPQAHMKPVKAWVQPRPDYPYQVLDCHKDITAAQEIFEDYRKTLLSTGRADRFGIHLLRRSGVYQIALVDRGDSSKEGGLAWIMNTRTRAVRLDRAVLKRAVSLPTARHPAMSAPGAKTFRWGGSL